MKGQKGYAIAPSISLHGWRLRASAAAVWQRLKRWQELAAQRRQLAGLSDAALKDIGLSRADVYLESERPFWDDPLATAAPGRGRDAR